MTDNGVVHLVLAGHPGCTQGVKGISLFLVPKFLVSADGSLGQRTMFGVSIEHKLGIHASPTCVMSLATGTAPLGTWSQRRTKDSLICSP